MQKTCRLVRAPVASIMSAPLIAIDKSLTVGDAAETMLINKLRHLGVRDGNEENGIIGVISSVDLMKFLIEKLQSNRSR